MALSLDPHNLESRKICTRAYHPTILLSCPADFACANIFQHILGTKQDIWVNIFLTRVGLPSPS
jgi:hypothetical protein